MILILKYIKIIGSNINADKRHRGLDESSNSSTASIPEEEQFKFLDRSCPMGTKAVKSLSRKKGKRKKAVETEVDGIDNEDIIKLIGNTFSVMIDRVEDHQQ